MKRVIYLLIISIVLTCCNDRDSKKHKNADEVEASKIELHGSETEKSGFEDGVYTATVNYYNPGTGHSATYTLDVEVEDNQVTIIYFPNGGYLDDDRIWPDELDEDGYVSIDGENGKTYKIQINY